MEWLKMSPEYRVHTAIGNDGYEGPAPWMKTKKEIQKEKLDKLLRAGKMKLLKITAKQACRRLKKLENKLRSERLKQSIK